MARAISSLPVPVSPTIRTQARDGATRRVVRTTSCSAGLPPITPGRADSSPTAGAAVRLDPGAEAPGIVLRSSGIGSRPSRGSSRGSWWGRRAWRRDRGGGPARPQGADQLGQPLADAGAGLAGDI